MPQQNGLNRRAFLKNVGLTALVGAVGPGTSLAGAAAGATVTPQASTTFDFDTVYDRVGTDSVKWDAQIARFGRDNVEVGMGIADMDFKAAPCIARALAERCQHENWGYLSIPPSYIEAIVNWNKRRYGLDIDPASIVLSNGVNPALIAAVKTFSPPGSKALLMTPTFNGFYGDLRAAGAIAEDSPMTLVNGRYAIDFDDLESRIDHDTNTLVLCNPHNPTGNCWSPADLMRVGEICLRRRVVVLSDEIHCDFVTRGNTYTPFASLPDQDIVDNSITFKAASKSFSLSAMKSSWFFSTNPDYLARVRANQRTDLNTLGMVANRAALTEGDEWLDQVVSYIDGNHDFVESYLRDNIPIVTYTKGQGTYLAWLDVSEVIDKIGAKQTAEDASQSSPRLVTPEMIVERWFVENAKVQLRPGSSFGTGGAGRMRMNIATSRKLIEQVLDNMAEALSDL